MSEHHYKVMHSTSPSKDSEYWIINTENDAHIKFSTDGRFEVHSPTTTLKRDGCFIDTAAFQEITEILGDKNMVNVAEGSQEHQTINRVADALIAAKCSPAR